ncbi:MAG: sugar phosphate isomerase/epimerase, partial [Bryobacteraceae bacterium]|nr:sugar phosphate isomerase/epimerase [Bryobacteraceae bacterium]
MSFSRRSFLRRTAAFTLAPAAVLQARRLTGLKIGVTDWNLRQTGKTEAVALAASLGFDGVEVSLGRKPVDGKLPLADPGVQEQYLAETRKHGIAVAGTCLDILHVNYLKNDPLGQRWVADGIPITKKLN